jgi:hypothetical protein
MRDSESWTGKDVVVINEITKDRHRFPGPDFNLPPPEYKSEA